MYKPVATEVTRLLSTPRLRSYVGVTSDRSEALRLYAWNIEIGSAFFAGIHYLEVGLRNHIDEHLTAWAAATPSSGGGASVPWYLHPALPFQQHPGLRRKVGEAIRHAQNGAAVPAPTTPPGKVVAEFSFGFWWSLFAATHSRTIWSPCLNAAFPAWRMGALHTALDRVRLLRNRISHHEPIHGWDLDAEYQHLINTAARVSQQLGWWIDSTSHVQEVLRRRP